MSLQISDTVMRGFSSAEEVRVSLDELTALQAFEREQSWYAKAPRYADHPAISGSVATGRLVKIETSDDYKLVGRFRNPHLETLYPPYLTPRAASCLQWLGGVWRRTASEYGVPKQVKLAVTSLVRSQAYQNELVAKGKLALPNSTHVTGNAFDIDLGGFYVDLADIGEAVVSLRHPQAQERIARAFQDDVGATRYDPVRFGPEYFCPGVSEALLSVTADAHAHGDVNAVIEMPHSVNRVLHIAVNPEFQV